MKISDYDANFRAPANEGFENLSWYDCKEQPFKIYGLYQTEKGKPFLRMPEDVAKATSEGVYFLNTNTAGGRVRFQTDSGVIAIKAVMPETETMPHITFLGQSGFDLYDKNGFVHSFFPVEKKNGYISKITTRGELTTYTINMPLYDGVYELYIGLEENAELLAPEEYAMPGRVLYYGSSITQGGCASRPGNAYQALISRRFDWDFVNLGFSGSGRGEEPVVKYMAKLDCAFFVCDYDHNAWDAEYLRKTHYPMYRAFRDGHPDAPVLFVSKPDFSPLRQEDADRRNVIIETQQRAYSEGDRKTAFLDGATLFNGEDRDSCTVDTAHPNDLGFFRMARAIGDAMQRLLQAK